MLTAVFSAWCPWNGIRQNNAGLAALEYMLLFVGASAALISRTFLLALGVDPFGWDGFCEVAATILLFVLAIRATLEWRRLFSEDELTTNDAASAGEGRAIRDDPEASYGTIMGKWTKTLPEGWCQVLSTALLLPSVTVFFAEAGDRSQDVLLTADHERVDLALGASLGFASSVAIAVCCGYVMKSQSTEKWLLFLVTSLFWMICIASLRDALMRLVLGTIPRA